MERRTVLPSGVELVEFVEAPPVPPPATVGGRDLVAAALSRSGGYVTLLGILGRFVCHGCGRDLGKTEYAGGVWVGDEPRRHVLICTGCRNDLWPSR